MGITISKRQILNILCALSIACIFMLSACSSSAVIAKEGDTVKVLYVGTFDDGTVFQSSEDFDNEPLQFTIGSGQVLPGFEQTVIGMSLNETRNVHIEMEDAYGPYNEELIITLNRSEIGESNDSKVGDIIVLTDVYGQQHESIVINVSEESVTVDANHPLAGENLNFEITMVEIVPAAK